MPLVSTGDIVGAAAATGCGVGAFNAIQLEHAEAIVAGAEQAGLPVIVQLSENAVRYHGALAPLARAVLELARGSGVPVAVHLDHATDPALLRQAVELGIDSVMFDASALDYADNVAATAAVAAECHAAGGWVEAELGEVGGKDGVHAPGARTDPAEAARFTAATGVDALAVAVGSSHAMLTRDARLDFALITALREAVPVPLVLHGSSGVSEPDLIRGVAAGITKVNVGTHLNGVLTAAVREVLAGDPRLVDPRKYLGPGRRRMAEAVGRTLDLLHRPGRRRAAR